MEYSKDDIKTVSDLNNLGFSEIGLKEWRVWVAVDETDRDRDNDEPSQLGYYYRVLALDVVEASKIIIRNWCDVEAIYVNCKDVFADMVGIVEESGMTIKNYLGFFGIYTDIAINYNGKIVEGIVTGNSSIWEIDPYDGTLELIYEYNGRYDGTGVQLDEFWNEP